MKRNYIYILIILLITILIFKNTNIVVLSVNDALNIWTNKLLTSIFPFLVIGSILIDLGFTNMIGKFINKITYKLFKINGNMASVLILSMFSGFPSSAKYVKELLIKNDINDDEASKLLSFTHFSNPLFVISNIKFNSYKVLFSHYISNFIIAFILRNYSISSNKNNTNKKNKSFSLILSNSITSSINTLIYIFATLCIYLILINILNNYLNISSYYKCIINGIIEMSSGINNLTNLNISHNSKSILSLIFISFGGVSVHTQILGIISDTNIKYNMYLKSRLMHVVISVIIYIIISFI